MPTSASCVFWPLCQSTSPLMLHQVLMVIFDIMVSHYNMTRWHEAGLTQHKGDLAAIQAAKQACKQRLLLQNPQPPAHQANPHPQSAAALHQSALGLASYTQPADLNQTPQTAYQLPIASSRQAVALQRSDAAAQARPVASAASASAGSQPGLGQQQDSPRHVDCDRPTAENTAADPTVPRDPSSLHHSQPGNPPAGSSPAFPTPLPTPEASTPPKDARMDLAPTATNQLTSQSRLPSVSQVAGSSEEQQQQQQSGTSLPPAVPRVASSPQQQQQQQPAAAAQAKLSVRFDAQVPAAPSQAAAAPQQQRHGRYPAHHSVHAAGEKVHAGLQLEKSSKQEQWRAELEVKYAQV